MEQFWRLMSPSTGDPAYIRIRTAGQLIWYCKLMAWLFVVPSLLDQDSSKITNTKHKIVMPPTVSQHCSTTLSSLPVELHDLVFQELSIQDVCQLSLASRYFQTVGQKHIRKFLISLLGPWAGKSIICVREYLRSDDNLPEVLTEAEKEVTRSALECCSNCDDDLRSLAYKCRSFHHIFGPGPYRNYMTMRCAVMSTLIGFPIPKHSFYSQDEPWILRNLTTKEYVCSEAIALKPEYINSPHIDPLGFGQVLSSRICWSSDGSISTPYQGGLNYGVWAGHCFDIRTLASHMKLTEGEESQWTDVSEEVVEENEAIWRAEFGVFWRERLIERDF